MEMEKEGVGGGMKIGEKARSTLSTWVMRMRHGTSQRNSILTFLLVCEEAMNFSLYVLRDLCLECNGFFLFFSLRASVY